MNRQEFYNVLTESEKKNLLAGLSVTRWSDLVQAVYADSHKRIFDYDDYNKLDTTDFDRIIKGLGSYNYKVGNGGHAQWDGNGYRKEYDVYMNMAFEYVMRNGNPQLVALHQVKSIYEKAVAVCKTLDNSSNAYPSDEDWDNYEYELGKLDKAYYAVGEENYFEAVAAYIYLVRTENK